MAEESKYAVPITDSLPFSVGVDDIIAALSGFGIFLIVWFVGNHLIGRDRFATRLKSIQERRAELKGQMTAAQRRRQHGKQETITFIRRVVNKFQILKQDQMGQLQTKLTNAGYRSKDAIVVFAFGKLVMPFTGLAIGALAANIDWSNAFTMDQAEGWLIVLGIAYFSARLPEILVSNARQKRYNALRRALPDALDLMMVCAEAGLSLAASLDRVARELSRVSPELAEEFSLTSVELGFLPDRATALKHLHDRANLPEIRGFVNVITQTEKYGTPIAQALRVLSKEYRTQRMLRAEQRAARLPAMMTVPMIVFILPTLFIVVMAPAVISIMDNF